MDGQPYSVCGGLRHAGNGIYFRMVSAPYKGKAQPYLLVSALSGTVRCAGDRRAEQAVSQQIVLDYLIANEDRHQGQLRLRYAMETLEFIGGRAGF